MAFGQYIGLLLESRWIMVTLTF
uniref:Uncharacterized protein n=1 Tax=Rhizophora mucronata TaxID=61149 RepID=A0A2P2Q3V9_RHIMU